MQIHLRIKSVPSPFCSSLSVCVWIGDGSKVQIRTTHNSAKEWEEESEGRARRGSGKRATQRGERRTHRVHIHSKKQQQSSLHELSSLSRIWMPFAEVCFPLHACPCVCAFEGRRAVVWESISNSLSLLFVRAAKITASLIRTSWWYLCYDLCVSESLVDEIVADGNDHGTGSHSAWKKCRQRTEIEYHKSSARWEWGKWCSVCTVIFYWLANVDCGLFVRRGRRGRVSETFLCSFDKRQ